MTGWSTSIALSRFVSLRPYQEQYVSDIRAAWADRKRNVCARLPTGGRKTKSLATIHREETTPSIVFAHRHELVSQLSKALAQEGVRHKVIGAETTIRACHQEHIAEFGTTFVNQQAACAVASVDTLIRAPGLESWASQVRLWTNDEAHHLVVGNKWS